jgi:hypothetical protein
MLRKTLIGNNLKVLQMKWYILLSLIFSLYVFTSCEKRDYNRHGLEEYSNHYYAAYLPNNNSVVTAQRNQAALLKLAVQFYSAYVRDYDAVTYYKVSTNGISNPAVLGQDYAIVDKSGNPIQPDNGKYSIVFPQSKRATDTIYVKMLNSTVAGTRRVEVQLMDNLTDKYEVDTFSTAYKRPIDIK